MLTMRTKKLILGVSILAAPAFATAQSEQQLIQKYTVLVAFGVTTAQAGISATNLVNGLRDGTQVTMRSPVKPTATACMPPLPVGGPVGIKPSVSLLPPPPAGFPVVFTPKTGKMGYGNVDNALTLAQESLASIGILTQVTDSSSQRPVTADDVCVALMGGVVKTKTSLITLPGILKLRAEGLGWGEIAKQVDAKL